MRPRILPRDEHRISRKLIDPDALKIMKRLKSFGFKAYLVGGGVRDILLDKKPKDFDIATDALPSKIRSIFRNSRIIGKRFKLVHVYFHSGKIIEVATFRDIPLEAVNDKDVKNIIKSDNLYGNEFTDALRRDITINALFYDLATFSIIDYVGGIDDLKEKIVRVIGDPKTRFEEDPVRIIRVIRHACRAGCEIEESCAKAIKNNFELVKDSSQARIYEELKKDLMCGHFYNILHNFFKYKIIKFIFPALNKKELYSKNSSFSYAIKKADELIEQQEVNNCTEVFAAIVVCLSMQTKPHEFFTTFKTKAEIIETTEVIFQGILVPRKEKERVVKLLAAVGRLVRNYLKTSGVHSFSQDQFEELNQTIALVEMIDSKNKLPELISELRKRKKNTINNKNKKRKRNKR